MPRTVLKRLRTKASLALNMNRKGSNPMLVCLLSCPKVVDPQFVMLMNRIMLFRQVLRELPEYKDMFLHSCCTPQMGGTKDQHVFGWTFTDGALCTHEDGRFFHLYLSPPKQVYSLLCSSWSDFVCTQVNHRKGLENLESIDLQITKSMPTLLLSERGLVLCQQTGAFFTEDTRKHCGGTGICPKCGQQDSRKHRLEECPFCDPVRAAFPGLMAKWNTLSDPIRYFGLFPEPAEYRVWQRCLLDIPFPEIVRSPNQALHLVYTDGSCLFPRWEHLRVASYSAIFAKPDGSFEIIAQGLLPSGYHTAYRAEIFGMSVAFGTYTRVEVALDCKGVVDTATYLLEQLKSGKPVSLPRDNTDLWAYFLQSLQGCSIDECKVRLVHSKKRMRGSTIGLIRSLVSRVIGCLTTTRCIVV